MKHLKLTQLIPAVLCLAALLGGCGADDPARDPTVVWIEDVVAPGEPLNAEQSEAMSRYMCANRALIEEDRLYTLDYDEAQRPLLACYELAEEGVPRRVLAEDCVPSYLCSEGGWLCFVNSLNGQIERLRPDGSARETLVEGPCTSLQIADGRLYYLDDRGRFWQAGLDGGQASILLEGPCAYPYMLGDILLYQKENEGESLYLYDPTDGRSQKLSDGPAYAPVYIGSTLYFTRRTDAGGQLVRLTADRLSPLAAFDTPPLRGTAEFFRQGELWYARVAPEGQRLTQRILPLSGGEETDCAYSGYHLCDYVGGGRRIDAVYEADGRLHSFEFVELDGSSALYMAGRFG